jgi:ribulose-5-phosphate 4-epimerase/fuculose-1-phosphate aldolase
VSPEAEARANLALCGRALARLGVYGLGGHLSLRIPDSELILITPGGGLDKSRLEPDHLVTIDATGKRVTGPYPPPRETAIHTVIHAARPELGSVGHLHPHWATIFSIVDVPLEVVLLPAACLGGPLPTFDEPRLVTTPEIGQRLNAVLGDAAGVLMRWHGATVVGHTLEEMFTRAVALEENARLLWEARAIGAPIPLDVRLAERQTAGPGIHERTFNYYANLERGADQQRHVSRFSGEVPDE